MNNSDKPASPVSFRRRDGSGVYVEMTYKGLTKLEHFSGVAMQGFLARYGNDEHTDVQIADWSVSQAEALLARLDKEQSNDN